MKISTWLDEVDYAVVYDSAEMKADFQTHTGYTAPAWYEETLAAGCERDITIRGVAETPADFRDWRPIPATMPRDTIVTYGITIAEAVERTFVPGLRPDTEHYSGRGRNHRAIVETLRRAGL